MPMKAVSALQKKAAAIRAIRNNIKYKVLMFSIHNPADYPTRQFNNIITSGFHSVKELALLPILHFHLASGIIDTEMVQIELVPDLSHCIETVARKEHENLVKSYLQSGKGDSELRRKIELLRSFLESADFRELRKQSEGYLLKGQKIKFILHRERGKAKYRMLRS
jgi:hypothetical protein